MLEESQVTFRPELIPQPILHLLIVDDVMADVELIVVSLEAAGINFTYDTADTALTCQELLHYRNYDAVLSDYRLPDLNGLEVLKLLQHSGQDIPLILVTGALGEEAAVECIKAGMTDYVIKERLFRLPMVLARALQEFEVRRQKEAAIAQIRAAAWREAMINRIVQTMRGTLVLDEVLQTTVDQLQDVLQVSYGLICRPEFHHQTRSCYVSQGTRERQGLIEVHYHFCGYYQQRLDRDEAVVLNRIDCQPRGELEETARDCGIRSLTIVPLIYQQSYLGEISLHQCDRQRNWTADELALVRAIADHCAIAIHQVQLYQQAQTELAERQRMEVALAQQASELARSNAELAQFAYVASHDLQEPLGIVASYTQLLAKRYRGQLDAKADKFITYIVEGVTRMQTLIQDLLGYSYLGRASKNFQPTDCKAACDLAIANLKIAIQKSGATITLGELPTVMADATQLVQLFQNLIGNGIKYRSNKPPFVEVKAQRQEDKWLFSVRDNGIGIEPQYAERIFMIFQRLHTREEYPGTGIGLAICKKIVEHHGGRIWMESQLGHGATFYFTIPQEG